MVKRRHYSFSSLWNFALNFKAFENTIAFYHNSTQTNLKPRTFFPLHAYRDNRTHQKQTKAHGDKAICISFSSLSWIFTNDQKNFSGMIYLEAAVFGLSIYRTCESSAILSRLSEGEREWNSSVFLLRVELNYA